MLEVRQKPGPGGTVGGGAAVWQNPKGQNLVIGQEDDAPKKKSGCCG